jgi:hypothetical protein
VRVFLCLQTYLGHLGFCSFFSWGVTIVQWLLDVGEGVSSWKLKRGDAQDSQRYSAEKKKCSLSTDLLFDTPTAPRCIQAAKSFQVAQMIELLCSSIPERCMGLGENIAVQYTAVGTPYIKFQIYAVTVRVQVALNI